MVIAIKNSKILINHTVSYETVNSSNSNNNKILELLYTSGHDSTAPPSAHHRRRHPSRTACPGSSCAPDSSDPCSQRADDSRVPSTTRSHSFAL